MWLQPPFFSMEVPHLGHAFVFATSQLNVSESSRHLIDHWRRSSHVAGKWSSSMQPKQKRCAHEQRTESSPARARTAAPQSEGHHLSDG